MADIIVMKTSGKTAPKLDAGTPDPAKLIKGKYKTKTWNHFTGVGVLPLHRGQGDPDQ